MEGQRDGRTAGWRDRDAVLGRATSEGLQGPSHLEFFLWLLRGDKYGFITYRYSEHAALSLKNGTSLRKRNEPSFQLSSGGLGHFFWTRYTDLGKKAGAAFSEVWCVSAQTHHGTLHF